eukprot:2013323-Prymnesium_polylepis.1
MADAGGADGSTTDAESIEAAGYELGDALGEGRFSQVVRGTHLATGDRYAVKIVDLESIVRPVALELTLSALLARLRTASGRRRRRTTRRSMRCRSR